MLDVEEEGLNERSIISLDAATRITKNGTSCFSSSSLDGKERCDVNALPGECDFVNSFGTDGRRHLQKTGIFLKYDFAKKFNSTKGVTDI